MRRWVLLSAALVAGGLLAGAAVLYVTRSPYDSPSCEALGVGWNSVDHQSGLTYLCGAKAVSDGRLSLSLDSYRFASGNTLDWTCPADNPNGTTCPTSGVFLLANITVANVGKGNTSIGPAFYANVTNGAEFVGNGEYGANIAFPGLYPNRSVPSNNGGAFLPPGRSTTYWFVFYLPNTALKDTLGLKLNNLSYVEREYGGDWDGGGGFNCVQAPCQSLMADLIITA